MAYKDLAAQLATNGLQPDTRLLDALAHSLAEELSVDVKTAAIALAINLITQALHSGNSRLLTDYATLTARLLKSGNALAADNANAVIAGLTNRLQQGPLPGAQHLVRGFFVIIYGAGVRPLLQDRSLASDSLAANAMKQLSDLLHQTPFHAQTTIEMGELVDSVWMSSLKKAESSQFRDLFYEALRFANLRLMPELTVGSFELDSVQTVKSLGSRLSCSVRERPDYSYSLWRCFRQKLINAIEDARVSGRIFDGLGKILCQQFSFDRTLEPQLRGYVQYLSEGLGKLHQRALSQQPVVEVSGGYDSDLEYDDIEYTSVDYGEWHLLASELVTVLKHGLSDAVAETVRMVLPLIQVAEIAAPSEESREEVKSQASLWKSKAAGFAVRTAVPSDAGGGCDLSSLTGMKEALSAVSVEMTNGVSAAVVETLGRLAVSQESFVNVLDVGGGVQIKSDNALSIRKAALRLLRDALLRDRRVAEAALTPVTEAIYHAVGDDVGHETYELGLACLWVILDRQREIDPRSGLQPIVNVLEAVSAHGEFRKLEECGDTAVRERLQETRATSELLKMWIGTKDRIREV